MNTRSLRLLVFSLTVVSCGNDEKIEAKKSAESGNLFVAPSHFPKPVYDTDKFPVTKEGFALGKMLFFDDILSADSTISCGACHQQPFAFTHHLHDVSHGIKDRLGTRNAPSLQNMVWQKEFMWDGGVHNLDLQPIAPIENPVEMDNKLSKVIQKLNNTLRYKAMFKSAFDTEEITTERFLNALTQYVTMLVSSKSKYDNYLQGKASLSSDELKGLQILQTKCSPCHSGVFFTDNSFRNNGLPATQADDKGRYDITQKEEDKYKFKVPSLRNIMKTGPYMHDGRFSTILKVLNHYDNDMKATQNIDTLFTKTSKTGIELSEEEKAKIIIFFQTLTDNSFLSDTSLALNFNKTFR
ncbi:MAG: cytochrome c peroxidase [Cytophagales bacterium]|nr:cytochrome c peroxidase [Cytophagales bacterium]